MSTAAGDLDLYRGWTVVSLELEGLPEGVPSGWANGLALKPRRRLLGWKRARFSPSTLNDDISRLRLQLARHGYPRAEVAVRVDPDAGKEQIRVVLEVHPGLSVQVAQTQVVGWPDRLAPLDSTWSEDLQPGAVFRDKVVQESERALLTRLMDSGYETPRIETRVELVAQDRVRIVHDVNPGPYSRIDSFLVKGCSPDLVPVARRMVDLDLPMDYSESRLRKAALDLRRTQLFRQVELVTEEFAPGRLLLRANLENARMRVWRAGVGTWSDNPWLVRAGWTHRNLFGHGVGFETDGRFGAYEWEAGARVFWLGWLTPASRTSTGLSVAVADEDAYYSREEKLSLNHAFGDSGPWQWKLGANFSLVEVEQHHPVAEDLPEAQAAMLELWSDWLATFTDSPTVPTRGHYFKFSVALSPPGFVSEAPYAALQVDGGALRRSPIGGILAFRSQLGISRPLGGKHELLPTRRFYAGGYNTMRGYRRHHLGPRDLTGDPRGGQFSLLAGTEWRFPLVWLLDGALFFDAGQVWRSRTDVVLGDLSGAMGVALDLRTPIGPVRVNYARNVVNLLPGEGRDLFTVGVGYPW